MQTRIPRRVGAAVVVALVGLGLASSPALAAKKPKSCTIVKAKDMAKIVGHPVVVTPDQGPTAGDACSFDLGPGEGQYQTLGGLGLIVVQYHTGAVAKGITADIKKNGEKVGKVYWDPRSGIAETFTKSKLVGVSVDYYHPPADPPPVSDDDAKAQAIAIAKLARKKL